MKTCIACGMPMEKSSDYAMGDDTKDYCKYCARPDGSMQSYEEKLVGTIEFLVKTQGIDRAVAKINAVNILAELPAWRTQKN